VAHATRAVLAIKDSDGPAGMKGSHLVPLRGGCSARIAHEERVASPPWWYKAGPFPTNTVSLIKATHDLP